MRTLKLGDATISIINLGDIVIRLKDMENVPETEWQPRYGNLFETPMPSPSQSVLIAVPGSPPVLVDAGDYSVFASADPSYIPQGYEPPPGLIAQLGEVGVNPEDFEHVIITHAHLDHFAGITRSSGNDWEPSFPKAHYYLGKADWEDSRIKDEMKNPDSYESRTLDVIHRLNMLELVEGSREISREVRIIPSPGESPGHQIVRVHSEEKTLYCLGDLFHHSVEVENTSWMAQWNDPQACIKSRNELIKNALNEDALLLAAHMPLGKLERSENGIIFVETNDTKES